MDGWQGEKVRLVIMTSQDTHLKTQELITRNAHFGAHPDQIKVVVQDQVPALLDAQAHIALHPQDANRILSKPHGHGDVHRVLYATGTIAWLEELGVKWLYFFQDSNALALKPLAATLGISVQEDLDMNSECLGLGSRAHVMPPRYAHARYAHAQSCWCWHVLCLSSTVVMQHECLLHLLLLLHNEWLWQRAKTDAASMACATQQLWQCRASRATLAVRSCFCAPPTGAAL
jgi:hypothetical protein